MPQTHASQSEVADLISKAIRFYVSFTALICLLSLITIQPTYATDISNGTRGIHTVSLAANTATGNSIDLYAESHALLIGVSQYTGGWSALPSIPTELDDVERKLVEQNFNVIKVADPSYTELKSIFEDFFQQYGYKQHNRLLVYFAGHGESIEHQGYLVASDTPNSDNKNEFKRKGLSMRQINTWASEITAKHALFVFDSCFSGSIFSSRGRPSVDSRLISQVTSEPVRQFITAGSADETVPAVSKFTPAFVAALGGAADYNEDGFITGSEIGLYLSNFIGNYGTNQTPQYGKIRDQRLDKGDFVFFTNIKPERSRVNLKLFRYGQTNSKEKLIAFLDFYDLISQKIPRLSHEIREGVGEHNLPRLEAMLEPVLIENDSFKVPHRLTESEEAYYKNNPDALGLLTGAIDIENGTPKVWSKLYWGDLGSPNTPEFIDLELSVSGAAARNTVDSHSIATLFALAMNIKDNCSNVPSVIYLMSEAEKRTKNLIQNSATPSTALAGKHLLSMISSEVNSIISQCVDAS